jgi:peptidoglycan/LPS O-acetylase OafA/YrhL
MSSKPGAGTDRLHALDAVRGFALLLGVFLHSAGAYIPNFAGWSISDDPSLVTASMFYVIHIFRMTTFFFLAGFFARLALERKGARSFIVDRLTRVLVPLIVAWPLIKPLMTGAAKYWGSVVGGSGALPYELVTPFQGPGSASVIAGFPWGHLWFLYMLLWFYAAALVLRWTVNLIDRWGLIGRGLDPLVGLLVKSHLGPILLGAPFLAIVLTSGDWQMYFGIPAPIFGLVPPEATLVGHGMAFGLGWLVHRQIGLIRVWERGWWLYLAAAVGCSAACLWLIGPVPVLAFATLEARTVLYGVLYMVAAWAWTFAFIGAALKFLSGYSAARRYIADASYWIYLVHVPLVMAIHVGLSRFEIPSLAKYGITLGIALPILFASYQLLVRYSVIGRVLNGRRKPAGSDADGGSGQDPSRQPSSVTA